jgi:integrase
VLSGALKRAVRWGWLTSNPIVRAEPPPAPKAKPRPPSPEEAGRILTEAWADPDWGTLVWMAIVTGVRRGELCALRWRDVDLTTGVISLSRSIGQRNRETWEKDTKDHQHRRIALDPETVEVLVEHRNRMEERCAVIHAAPPPDAFVFSLTPDNSTYMRPNSVSERYSDLADRLGIATSLHKLRHYSATFAAVRTATNVGEHLSTYDVGRDHRGCPGESRPSTADFWKLSEDPSADPLGSLTTPRSSANGICTQSWPFTPLASVVSHLHACGGDAVSV